LFSFICRTWKADITPISSAMSCNIVALPTLITLRSLLQIMNSCSHSGFPVVRHINDADRYVGVILRRQLRVILAMKRIEFRSGCEIPDFDTKVFIAMKDSHRSKELNIEAHVQDKFTEPFVNQQINLSPFMNRFVVCFRVAAPLRASLSMAPACCCSLQLTFNVFVLAAARFRSSQT
jgi:CBS domain containing-hemolysin-like protein